MEVIVELLPTICELCLETLSITDAISAIRSESFWISPSISLRPVFC